jgi:hypothetical protein
MTASGKHLPPCMCDNQTACTGSTCATSYAFLCNLLIQLTESCCCCHTCSRRVSCCASQGQPVDQPPPACTLHSLHDVPNLCCCDCCCFATPAVAESPAASAKASLLISPRQPGAAVTRGDGLGGKVSPPPALSPPSGRPDALVMLAAELLPS